MFRVVSLAIAILAAVTTVSLAQVPLPLPNPFEGTPREQAACRPDSVKYCKEAFPDNFRVLACLQSHRARISAACRAVLESHGQ